MILLGVHLTTNDAILKQSECANLCNHLSILTEIQCVLISPYRSYAAPLVFSKAKYIVFVFNFFSPMATNIAVTVDTIPY